MYQLPIVSFSSSLFPGKPRPSIETFLLSHAGHSLTIVSVRIDRSSSLIYLTASSIGPSDLFFSSVQFVCCYTSRHSLSHNINGIVQRLTILFRGHFSQLSFFPFGTNEMSKTESVHLFFSSFQSLNIIIGSSSNFRENVTRVKQSKKECLFQWRVMKEAGGTSL